MSRPRQAALFGIVALLLIAPIAGIAVVTLWDSHNSLQPATLETVPVRSVSADSSSPVDIALSWTSIPPVFAPSWSGTVTAVGNQTTWKSGDLIVQVDRVWRMAYASAAPFTRPLSVGDSGADVSALRALLASLGLPHESGGALGGSTMRGVQQLAVRVGVVDTVTSFDPSWIIFLPRPTIVAAGSVLQLGGPAPAPGEPIVPTGQELSDGTLVAPGQFGTLAANTAPLPATPTVSASNLVASPASDGSRLLLGTTAIGMNSAGTQLSVDGLAAIAGTTVPGAAYIEAEIVTPAQRGDFVVPAASIVVDVSGATCVLADGVRQRPIHVTIVNNTDDSVEVQGRLTTADRLLVDIPAARRSCG